MIKTKDLTYLPNGDILEKTRGWCLVHDEEVMITNRYGVMGGLFNCPHCGELWKQVEESEHVFAPSGPLLAKLRGLSDLTNGNTD